MLDRAVSTASATARTIPTTTVASRQPTNTTTIVFVRYDSAIGYDSPFAYDAESSTYSAGAASPRTVATAGMSSRELQTSQMKGR